MLEQMKLNEWLIDSAKQKKRGKDNNPNLTAPNDVCVVDLGSLISLSAISCVRNIPQMYLQPWFARHRLWSLQLPDIQWSTTNNVL